MKLLISVFIFTVCDDDNECPLETDGDIRQTGTYKCIVKLHAKVDASFIFDVIAEVKA